MQKRKYKVLAILPRTDGEGDWFMRIGKGFDNKDASINVYLDAFPFPPKGGIKLQIRELDERDLRERDNYRTAMPAPSAAAEPSAQERVPF